MHAILFLQVINLEKVETIKASSSDEFPSTFLVCADDFLLRNLNRKQVCIKVLLDGQFL